MPNNQMPNNQMPNSYELHQLDPATLDLFINDICGGDEEIIADLLQTYCESTKALLRDMELSLKSGDHEELRRAAHSMKSSCRIFGAEWLATSCETIERLAVEKQIDTVPPLLDKVKEQSVQLRRLLQEQFTFHQCWGEVDLPE